MVIHMEKTNKKLQLLSIIALCCNFLLYHLNELPSLIIILLSAVGIVFMAAKPEKKSLCFGIFLTAGIVKLILAMPYIVPVIKEIPSIIAAIIILTGKNTKRSAKILIAVTAIITAAAATLTLVETHSIISMYLSHVTFSDLRMFAYKIISVWIPEIFSCYVYPFIVSLFILKNSRTEH